MEENLFIYNKKNMIPFLFSGILAGLFMVSIFNPVKHQIPELPTPNSKKVYKTKKGCVQFYTEEVSCSSEAISMNLINE